MSDKFVSKSGLILSLNSGSSSLKISLYRLSNSAKPDLSDHTKNPVSLILTCSITSISSSPTFSFSSAPGFTSSARTAKDEPADNIKDHASAFAHFLDYLKKEAKIERDQIVHICHRIVHGGDYYEPVIINMESYHHIEKLSDLAPLHNGAALSVVKASISELKHANNIAYFDTLFHHHIPAHIHSYAINPKVAKSKGLRKYGFHGLSYTYILRIVCQYLQKTPTSTNLIIMHLGSGTSICAIHAGKSLDTSMGLTPVSGLPGATRSGDIDPTLIFHYTHQAAKITHDKKGAVEVDVTEAEEILNKNTGWKALFGSDDFSRITEKMDVDENARLAFDLFVDRLINHIGAYHLKLGGEVDAMVFSGGIGERSVELRSEVVKRCACLGFVVDEEKNRAATEKKGEVLEITGAGVNDDEQREQERKGRENRVLICRTDEQLEMARECALEPRFWK